MIVLKEHPELRHVLAHMMEAIHMASLGDVKATQFELDSIEGLVLFDGEDDFRSYVDGMPRQEERKDEETSTHEKE